MLNDKNKVKEIDRWELTCAGNLRLVELILIR